MRITTSMIAKQYQKSLNSSLSSLNYYNNRATTYRKFDKVSEDPVAAMKAFRLRREYAQNTDYQTNLSNTQSLISTAESSMMSINSMVQEVTSTDCLQAINSTSGADERSIIATKLRKVQESIVSVINTKFADTYLFAGTLSSSTPFSIGANGELLYRGADVTTGELVNEDGAIVRFQNAKISFGADNQGFLNGYQLEVNLASPPAGTAFEIDDANKKIVLNLNEGATLSDLKDTLTAAGAQTVNGNTVDFSKVTIDGDLTAALKSGTSQSISNTVDLTALANEKTYVDLGLGLRFDSSGKIIEQSAFNTSLPGISFLGYGENADGIPNNIYTLIGKIADGLESADYSYEDIEPYIKNLEQQQEKLMTSVTTIGVQSNFLSSTQTRLENSELNLNEKISDVEYIDPAEAIMDFKMQEYSYRAALQMGTLILQPTFLDFMS